MLPKNTEKFPKTCENHEVLDPRVRRTRQLLQDALRGLLREKPFATISVQDITTRATVNRATFYAHYVDKEALTASVLKADLRAALLDQFTERPALTRENLMGFAVGVFEFLGKLQDACPETATEIQDTVGIAVQQGLYEIMEKWLSGSHSYRRHFPGCSRETVATVLSWSLYGGAYRWSRTKPRPPAVQVCGEIVAILMPASKEDATESPSK